MPKRSSSKKDLNEAAYDLVQKVTQYKPAKNPAAVALGKLGGLKGGKARAARLSQLLAKPLFPDGRNHPEHGHLL